MEGRPVVRVLRMAAGGEGVGHLEDGRAVFVPRSAPGDLVQLQGVELHARYARARIERLVEPGEHRVEPRCQHYAGDDCGGCQLQHLSVPAQLEAKRQLVTDALERIAHLPITVPEVEQGDLEYGYRNRITLAVRGGGRVVGYRRLGQPDRVFPVKRCELADPSLQRLWQALTPALRFLPADAEHLMLRVDRRGDRHLLVRTAGRKAWSGARSLAEGARRSGEELTVWYQPAGGAPRVVAGPRRNPAALLFEQVQPALADRIRTFAVKALGELKGRHVWDLYAGIGETTDRVLAGGASVESVELDRRAVAVAEQAPATEDAGRKAAVRRYSGRVEEWVGRLRPPDAVIVNPPRGGLGPGVASAIRDRRPSRMVYVSCDPATLARDLAILCGTRAPGAVPSGGAPLRLVGVRPYDLFPQTAHVETVAVLEAA